MLYMTADQANQFLFLPTLENTFLEPTEIQYMLPAGQGTHDA